MDAADYVKGVMKKLLPESTEVEPVLPDLPGIKAFVTDIYGTLIISAAGDISVSQETASTKAMRKVIKALGEDFADANPLELAADYESGIRRYQDVSKRNGTKFPEVEIREVWLDVLRPHSEEAISMRSIEEIALIYECAVNPVWEMTGAIKAAQSIREAGLRMGVISNAQFYTTAVCEGVLGEDLETIGFEENLTVMSYNLREGKPSERLYKSEASRLQNLGISPEQVFYLGNDLIKDVLPAAAVGFRTGLFAGDARSLRLGDATLEEAIDAADVVVTEWKQIPPILGINP
ncbi:MAG: hypothetical protein CMO55_18495 [Verrucomicrobiales bacterium]|nr:hypothetical protein [Verrucomicrobiales bacterium]